MSTIAAITKASNFLSSPRRMLIGGEWVEAAAGATLSVINPANGEELTTIPAAKKEDVDRAVAAARESFEDRRWRKMAPAQRAQILWKIAGLIDEHGQELAELETLDNGKPLSQSSTIDIPGAAETFRYYAGYCTKIEGKTVDLSLPVEHFAYTIKEPVGVAALITPWNFPLSMASWKLAPALAAGCSVIHKPAEETSLTALRLGELMIEAGVPAGVVNVLTGLGHEVGAALTEHDDVDKVAFTGSTEVGKMIVKAAAGNLKKVSLELGGKSPVVIMPDADMGKAVQGAGLGIFFNAGQVCTAGSRLFAHESVFDQVVEGISKMADSLKIGPGMAKDSFLGPLVSDKQLERVTGLVNSGREQGAEIVTGGERSGEEGYFYKPTVITNTKADMDIMREEIFGPVLCATPFQDLDEIAAQANDTEYGLSASVWTKDISTANRMVSKIKSGRVWVNCHNYADMALPFGGYKQSGWGRESGVDGLNLYLETKSVIVEL